MGHNHGSTDLDIHVDARVRQRMWIAVAVCALGVVVGMVVLWPGRTDNGTDPLGLDGDPISARVTSEAVEPCSYDPLLGCRQIELVPGSGDYAGERLTFEQSLNSPIRDNDMILVDISIQENGSAQIFFYDFERSTPY